MSLLQMNSSVVTYLLCMIGVHHSFPSGPVGPCLQCLYGRKDHMGNDSVQVCQENQYQIRNHCGSLFLCRLDKIVKRDHRCLCIGLLFLKKEVRVFQYKLYTAHKVKHSYLIPASPIVDNSAMYRLYYAFYAGITRMPPFAYKHPSMMP